MTALIEQILTIAAQILSLVSGIYGLSQTTAREAAPFQLETIASNGTDTVINPTFGNAALLAAIQASQSAILATIAKTQQAALPVQLPQPPPAGYGSSAAGAIASEVWLTLMPDDDTAQNHQVYAGHHGFIASQYAMLRNPSQPWLGIVIDQADLLTRLGTVTPRAPLDAATILGSDLNPSAWVQRQYPAYNWKPWVDQTNTVYYADPSGADVSWVLWMDQWTFESLKQQARAATSVSAPIWPGLANVQLGATVAIAPPTQTVAGPMDGVIVAITAVPVPIGYYQFGSDKSYVKAGGVAFQDDNSNDEQAQSVAFASAIVTPKSMAHAANALFRWRTGVTGTITPWTITSPL